MAIKWCFIFLAICGCFYSDYIYADVKGKIVFSAPIENNSARFICEDKLKLAFNQIGYEFVVSLMPAQRALVMSNNGTTNGEVSRIGGLNKKYPNLIQLSESCYSHQIYFYVRSGKEFNVDGWGSIPVEYLLGYRKGMEYIEFAAQEYKFQLYPMGNLDKAMDMLMLDRIDLIVGSTTLFKALLKKSNIKEVVRLEPAVDTHQFYSYIHQDYVNLLPQLNVKLAEINKL